MTSRTTPNSRIADGDDDTPAIIGIEAVLIGAADVAHVAEADGHGPTRNKWRLGL